MGVWSRRVAMAFAGLLALVGVAVLVITQTHWGRERVRRLSVERLAQSVNGDVTIGEVRGNLLSGARLIDVAIDDAEGEPFLRADTVTLDYSLRGLFQKRLELSDVRIVHPVVRLAQPPGGEWNVTRIFRGDTVVVAGDTIPGFGDWVTLRDVTVVGGNVTVRRAWSPPAWLEGKARARAIERALSSADRERVERAPGGYQAISYFRDLDAHLPYVRMADPDSAARVVEIGSLSVVALPFEPPPARIEDLSGRLIVTADTVAFADLRVRLPGSRLALGGTWSFGDRGGLAIRASGAPVSLADLRWLRPSLPDGGGSVEWLTVGQRGARTRMVAGGVDLRAEGASLEGSVDVTLGGPSPPRIGASDVRFAALDTRLLERLLEGAPIPVEGVLSGNLRLSGEAEDLRLDGRVALRERGGATSEIYAEGRILHAAGAPVARDLHLRLSPLRVSALRAAGAELPVGGTLEGTATLDGGLGALAVRADLVHRGPGTGRSHVTARGGLDLTGEPRARDLTLRFDPLQASVVRAFAPSVPVRGTLAGRLTLDGVLAGRLSVDADLVHAGPEVGRSHVLAVGDLGLGGEPTADGLRLHFDPLQTALVRELVPSFRPRGVLTGDATVSGSVASGWSADLDLTHEGPTGTSKLAGRARAAFDGALRSFDVDLTAQSLSLATLGLYAPAAGLHGQVSGPLSVEGTPERARLDVSLDVLGGGHLDARGTVDLGPKAAYDLTADLAVFDAAEVSTRAPTTALTGVVSARGVGTGPASADALLVAELVDSRVEGVPSLDTTRVRVRLANGVAEVERGELRLASARADLSGSFGLIAGRTGTLRYDVVVDSLSRFGGIAPTDTTATALRPLVRAREIDRARSDSAQVARAALVESVATRGPAPEPVALDTAPPLPGDSLSGSVRAEGVLEGNLERFELRGTAQLDGVVWGGRAVRRGTLEYTLANLGAPQPHLVLDGSLGGVRAAGFAFDSATVTVTHDGALDVGSGRLRVTLLQDEARDYALAADYVLELDRQELLLNEMMLRFDSTLWTSPHPGTVRWRGSGVELDRIELTNQQGGRVFADGRLPTEGSGDLTVVIDSLQVAHVAALLQDTLDTHGLLSLDAQFSGTLAAPTLTGDVALMGAERGGTPIPDLTATFDYADRMLTTAAEVFDTTGVLLRAEGTLPLDLALTGHTGRRLLPGPIDFDVRADSIPLSAVPALSAQVQDVSGSLRGTVSVRGTVDDPSVEGSVSVDLTAARLPAAGVRLTDGGGRLRFEGDRLVVDSFTARSEGGPLHVAGSVDLSNLARPELDLRLTAEDALLFDIDRGRASGDVALSVGGTLDSLRVAGDITLRQGVFAAPEPEDLQRATRLDDPMLGGVYAALAVDERMVASNPFLDRLDLDVEVRVARDTWMRNSAMNVEIYTPPDQPPLRVRIAPGSHEPVLEGVINADRGDYAFAGHEFRLTAGSVTFLGSPRLNPLLQLNARHEVPRPGREALVILINVGGTMNAPRVSLSSNAQPPIPESDLISYVAFGTESSSLLSREGSGIVGGGLGGLGVLAEQQLAGLGLGALTQTFVSNLERQGMNAGLDVFRVRPQALSDELNFSGYFENMLRGIQVEAGEYLNSRLFLSARGRLSGGVLPGVSLEYTTPRGFSWVTTWEPRFLPVPPTLGDPVPERSRIFGTFLLWRRRF